MVGTGTCTGEAKYPPGMPSAVTKEPAVLMLAWCFSTSSEIFRGSSYLGAKCETNKHNYKNCKENPKTMKWRDGKLQNVS